MALAQFILQLLIAGDVPQKAQAQLQAALSVPCPIGPQPQREAAPIGAAPHHLPLPALSPVQGWQHLTQHPFLAISIRPWPSQRHTAIAMALTMA
ncbi:hypothetical protein DFAR_2690033 [Desulfarculales bacterium]